MAKTTEPERLQDEETEAVLYDPQDPQRSVLVDSVPGSVHMDQAGAWATGENGLIKAAGSLVLPLIAAAEIALLWLPTKRTGSPNWVLV